MNYIQRRDRSTGQRETVDEFVSRKEARAMLFEYQICDHAGEYYISGRACRSWKDEPTPAQEVKP
jgi:hypothetical protein